MAKRKKKSSHRRRRRVGALSFAPTSPLVKFGSIAVGYLLGDTVNSTLNTVIKMVAPNLSPKTAGIGEAGLGALLSFGPGKSKSLIRTAGGGILLGAGLKRYMDASKAGAPTTITGYGRVPVVGSRRMSGYQSVPVIGNRPTSVNGYDAGGSLGAYNVNPKPFSNIMAGASPESGSGITNSGGGSCMG